MTASVVATAGHVDHGKSTLVKAMTGMDPDRFEEEKARGLTIDLGFAWATLPSGREMAFVDVPGHVRFLKNMLAGVGAAEGCLFVVAATEGWKPQSEEHLRILELLGVSHGVVALTKVASVDADTRELARIELAERLAGTFLGEARVVEVDAPHGIGLSRLVDELDSLAESMGAPAERERPRLWIDRSFPIRGSGTVVTGTLGGGSIAVNDRMEVVPAASPGHHPTPVRVRGLQAQGRAIECAGPGRVAVNLSGVAHDRVERGQALVAPGQWEPSTMLDASLTVLQAVGHQVGRRGAFRAYFGSGQHVVQLRLLHVAALSPGETGLVRLHLPRPVPLLPGDRYVLREVGRSETVGGGEVLDVAPVLPARDARPDRSVDRVVRERGFVDATQLARLTGERREPNLGARWVADPAVTAAAEARLRVSVESAGPLGLDVALVSEIDRALLAHLPGLTLTEGRARVEGTTSAEVLDGHWYLAALEASPFRPPSPAEAGVDPVQLRELVRYGRVVESAGCYFSPGAIAAATLEVGRLLGDRPDGVTASLVRETLGTTRKYVLPLLAHLDATGITRRRGELRVAGPKLPVPS